MDRILFLDFDGPLTNARTFLVYDKPVGRYVWTTADPVVIEFLNYLDRKWKGEFKIVISSTWRQIAAITPTKLSAEDSLRHWGYEGEIHKDKYTPKKLSSNRSHEILLWLEAHEDTILTHASLDDLPLAPHCNNVQVNGTMGMVNAENFTDLEAILDGKKGLTIKEVFS